MENIVYYSDFGAKGDGVTNDFYAMKAAHAYANEIGAKVLGNKDAVYYVGKTGGEVISVKTSVDFCGAHVIIDDRDITPNDVERRAFIFSIDSDSEEVRYGADSEEVKNLSASCPLDIDTKSLPIKPGYPAMAYLYNSEKMVYKRTGRNPNNGKEQHELVLIDENGNIDETTAILIPYEKVTSLVLVRIDDEPVTFENVTITTRANAAPREYTYYERNIRIARSNTTLKNVTHLITDEGEDGAPYSEFVFLDCANNVLILSCRFTGHKIYWENSGNSSMGSYEIGGRNSNAIVYKNCTQTNMFFEDGTYNRFVWGVMGSSYCKNITYDSCILSRFDAHAGVYNVKVINSTLANLRLTGGGEFLIENSSVYLGYEFGLISLREDYGCTWRGNMTFKNVTFHNFKEKDESYVIYATFLPNHNFGYQAYYPENITIDGLKLSKPAKLYLFSDVTRGEGCSLIADRVIYKGEEIENVNKMILPKNVTVKNVEGAISFEASPDKTLNSQIKIKFQ